MRVFMMATSDGKAPTRGAACSEACSASRCHAVSGESVRVRKWPWTPMEDQMSRWVRRKSRVHFGWRPRELPQK